MPSPQDMTDIEKMVADGIASKRPVPISSLAAAIKKQFPAPAGLSDGAVVKHFGRANPHLGMDRLEFDMSSTSAAPAPSPAPSAAPVSAGRTSAPPPSLPPGMTPAWNAATKKFDYPGAKTILTSSGPLAAPVDAPITGIENAATAPLRILGGGMEQTGRGLVRAAHAPNKSEFAGGVSDVARGVMTTTLPFAAPSILANPVAAAKMFGVGMGAGTVTEAGLKAAGVPEGYAEAAGTGAGVLAGGLYNKRLASKAGPKEVKTSPPPGEPGTTTPAEGGGAPPSTPPAAGAPPAAGSPPAAPKRNANVIDILRREAAADPKNATVSLGRIQVITGKHGEQGRAAAAKVLGQLLEDGVIDSNRRLLSSAPAAQLNAKVGKSSPAKAVTPPPEMSPEQAAAIQAAFGVTPEAPTAPAASAPSAAAPAALEKLTAPPSAASAEPAPPMTSKPTADSPQSSARPVTAPPPAAPDPAAAQIAANEARIAEIQRQIAAAPKPPAPVAAAPEPVPPAAPAAAPEPAPAAAASAAAEPAGGWAPDEAAAIARLKAKFGKFTKDETGTQYFDWKAPGSEDSPISPDDFRDLAAIGRGIVRRTGASFEAWKDEMVNQLGAWVESNLMPIWQQVRFSTDAPTAGAASPGAAAPPPGPASLAGAEHPPSPPMIRLKEGGPLIPVTDDLLTRLKAIGPTQAPPVLPSESAGVPSTFPVSADRMAGSVPPPAQPSAPAPFGPIRPGESRVAWAPGTVMPDLGQQLPSDPTAGQAASRVAAQGGSPIYSQRVLPIQTESPSGQAELTRAHAHDPTQLIYPSPPIRDLLAQGVTPEEIATQRAAALTQQPPDLPSEEMARRMAEAIQGRENWTAADWVAAREAESAMRARGGSAPAPTKASAAQEPLPPVQAKTATEATYPLTQALKSTGFQQRNTSPVSRRFAGVERPHVGGKTNAPRGAITRDLPSGNKSDQVWYKPVADGTIEVQWDSGTHEFEATKYYSDTGEARTVHGLGPDAMIDYLNGVRQREIPLQPSQRAGKSGGGRAPESVRIATATPPVAPASEPVRIATATPPVAPAPESPEAVAAQQLSQTASVAKTPQQLEAILLNIERRSKAGGLEPPPPVSDARKMSANERKIAELEKAKAAAVAARQQPSGTRQIAQELFEKEQAAIRAAGVEDHVARGNLRTLHFPESAYPPQPDKNAAAMAVLSNEQIGNIIANQVARMSAGRTFSPAEMATGKPIPAPTRKFAQLPKESPFFLEKQGEGKDWLVRSKQGGIESNVHITSPKTNRYEVYIGNHLMHRTSSLIDAKTKAIGYADLQAYRAAEQNTPFYVQNVGGYALLGESADGSAMKYMFMSEKGGQVVREMPKEMWFRLQNQGTPINPIPPPQGKVGRPSSTQAPPVMFTSPPPER